MWKELRKSVPQLSVAEDALEYRVTSGKGDGPVGLAIRKSPVRAKLDFCVTQCGPHLCTRAWLQRASRPWMSLCSPDGFIGHIEGRQGAKSNNLPNVPRCVYFLSRERNNKRYVTEEGVSLSSPPSLICHILASRTIFLKHQSTSQVLHK